MSDLNTTSGICLIAKQDPCFIQKTVAEVEMPHLSVSSNNITSPTIKSIYIDEDAKCFEKIIVDFDKVDEKIYSSLNLTRMNDRSVLKEDMTDNDSSDDLKPSSQEVLGSFGNTLKGNVGDEKFSDPVSTYLHGKSKPVMNDLNSFAEPCYSEETSAGKIPSEILNERRTYFSQEFDTGFLRVDSAGHNDSIDENQNLRRHSEQVTEQDEKLTSTTSPMQANGSSQIEETVNQDLFEDNKSSFLVTSTGIKPSRLGNIEGASYDVKQETRDISITGNEGNVVNNQQSVQKPVVVTVEEPIIDVTTSARSSFARLIHEESSSLGVASLLGLTTSGHIPYSGNLSHRSDSSTTSTHSFAFPILQSEWNSSPIKMAKADRRHLRKHRWKTILICCKF